MKNFLFLGLLLSLSAMGVETKSQISNELKDSPNCSVSLYGEYVTSQMRCMYNDVMTGIYSVDPLRLRCSRVVINCYNMDQSKVKQSQEKDQELEN